MTHKTICSLLLAAALTGCATITPMGPPPTASLTEIKAHIDPRRPAMEHLWGSAVQIPNSYFGLMSPARGSVVVGLLFGPLGVLANASYTQSLNEAKAGGVASYTSLNLAQMLREIDGSLAISPDAVVGEYSLLPTGRIHFLDDNRYLVACVLNVEFPAADKTVWKMRYDVNPEPVFVAGDPDEVAKVTGAIRSCLVRAMDLFVAHVSGKLGTPVLKTLDYSGLEIRVPVYTDKLPERIISNQRVVVQEPRKSVVKVVD